MRFHCILKFYVKGQGSLQNTTININYTQVNIYFNYWSKFSLNYRKLSKAVKFSRQPSKPAPLSH